LDSFLVNTLEATLDSGLLQVPYNGWYQLGGNVTIGESVFSSDTDSLVEFRIRNETDGENLCNSSGTKNDGREWSLSVNTVAFLEAGKQYSVTAFTIQMNGPYVAQGSLLGEGLYLLLLKKTDLP